ncbi:cupin domain-containing protein [Streptomyces sp. 3MP-14]|uniref:Cupin domain-containing protein n=1 Tax=Streptomyces mimosae TaxID=2586635 RepID=A0A5N6A296_9ACTN|nr:MULTISPECIES: cupin domain-containing protein [Streptomyces]KAB8162894.1 cupin domain-containing protein [Streptomyces mimosae]KAB8179107.1 cupin domain-containing protein [Streptomyces sp. 3MP-14]
MTEQVTAPAPVLVRAASAETVRDGAASLITLFADSAQTKGALTANRATLRRGSPGAPAHFHTRATELFFVLGGKLRVLLGESVVTLGAGDLVTVPPRLPHAFAPAPGTEADVLVAFTPGMDRFDYYRLLERVYQGRAGVEEIRASSERYDNHYHESPVWQAELARA